VPSLGVQRRRVLFRTPAETSWGRRNLSAGSRPALSERTTCRPNFSRMEALVCMAIAVLVVLLIDGVMLVQARRHG
jgi:hypothetical protein